MKKKQSIVILVICAVLTVLLGFTAIKGWGPTGTGSMANIRTGLDLSGGVSITYQTKTENPSQEDMDDTIYKLQQRVFQYSNEAQVYQQGSNRINIEIPGENDANAILEELGLKPIIHANLALGEGTGAVSFFPLLDMAYQVYRENATFEELDMDAYQDYGAGKGPEC